MNEQPNSDQSVLTEPQVTEPQATQPPETQLETAEPQAQEAPEVPPQDEGRKRAQATWDRIVGARARGETISGTVIGPVKGGLLVDIEGYRGFLPASQVRAQKGTPLETFSKTTVPLKVIDVDEQRKRVVVSHRRALDAERKSARADLLRSLKVGEEREATVVRLTDFGAFVDLGGVDALIPASELAFERVAKPADVVNIGERLKVRVLRVEENGKKIAVSRKGALADPWRDHNAILRQGNVVEGKIVAKEPALSVEIAPGVVGTIGEREADPADYEIGEAVEVSIRAVDFRNRRIRLSTLHSAQSFTSTSFAPLGVELRRS